MLASLYEYKLLTIYLLNLCESLISDGVQRKRQLTKIDYNARWRSRYLNSLISWKSWVQVPPLHQITFTPCCYQIYSDNSKVSFLNL